MPSVWESFQPSLEAILSRFPAEVPFAVAYSGGADSTALLLLAHRYAKEKGHPLHAFHIHHGISPDADRWLSHCQHICDALGVPFAALKVQVDRASGGVEADARVKRYRALGQLAGMQGVPLILTAHHLDDQCETILLQLFRGTFLAGLTGMASCVVLPYQTGGTDLYLGRPLLSVTRRDLEGFLSKSGIPFVEDASNEDTAYRRNALRHRVMPLVGASFPGFERHLAGTGRMVASALRLLDTLAAEDLADCVDGNQALDMVAVRRLGDERIDNLLRYWLKANQVRIRSSAWFLELKKQLMSSDHDVKTVLAMDGKSIRKYRDKVKMEKQETREPPQKALDFNWNGEPSIEFRTWYGILTFELGETGFDVDWFRGRIFSLRPYQGSARLALPGRPSKDLKSLYQEAGISGEDRRFLPSIWWADELVFAAGIGQSAKWAGKSGKCVRLIWKQLP